MKINLSIQEFCDIISGRSIGFAEYCTRIFVEFLETELEIKVSKELEKKIFKIFSFLNFAFSIGVWSNIKKKKFRRTLIITVRESFFRDISHAIEEDKYSLFLDFQGTNIEYISCVKQCPQFNIPFDSRIVICFGSFKLSELLSLTDVEEEMVLSFLFQNYDDITAIERSALSYRKTNFKKNFFLNKYI